MTKTKRILILIISALAVLLFGLVFVGPTTKQAQASTITEADFSWEPGASVRASTMPFVLQFTLNFDSEKITNPDEEINVEVSYCSGEFEIMSQLAVGERYLFKVIVNGPKVNIQVKATVNGIEKLSDTRSPLYIFKAAYAAGDTDWMTDGILALLDSENEGFIAKVESQEFVKLYQWQSQIVIGDTIWDADNAWDELQSVNEAVFDTVVSSYFCEDYTYRIEEIANGWDSLGGCYLYFTWQYDGADYGLIFNIKETRDIAVTQTGEFEYSFDYYFHDNYFYIKFDMFSSFNEENITNFNWTTSKETAVYMSMLEFDETEYTSALVQRANELSAEVEFWSVEADKFERLTETQKSEIAQLNSNVMNLEHQLNDKIAQINKLETRKAELEKQLAQAEDTHEIDTANIKKLSAELETVKTSLATDKKELVETITALNVELNDYKSKVQAYEKAEEESGEENGVSVGCSANASTSLPFICIVALVVSCIILGGKIYAHKKK